MAGILLFQETRLVFRWRNNLMSRKILLVDDDLSFCKLMKEIARYHGLTLDYFHSFIDLSSLKRIKEYDIAIFDYVLDGPNGFEIAEYVDHFYDNFPVFLISGKKSVFSNGNLPQSVRQFIPKDRGTDFIIQSVRRYLDRQDYLAQTLMN